MFENLSLKEVIAERALKNGIIFQNEITDIKEAKCPSQSYIIRDGGAHECPYHIFDSY